MTPDGLALLCYALFVGLVLYGALRAGYSLRRHFRGRFGRPYVEAVADLYSETERRAWLLLAVAEAQSRRIERVEKRGEPGR